MENNWYKSQKKQNKRSPIVLTSEKFDWIGNQNLDDCYNVVTAKVDDSLYNFYFWSPSTANTAFEYYKQGNFKKSLQILKKYSFDVNSIKNEENSDD